MWVYIYVQVWEHIGFLGIRFRYYIKSSQNPYGMNATKDNYILKFRTLVHWAYYLKIILFSDPKYTKDEKQPLMGKIIWEELCTMC